MSTKLLEKYNLQELAKVSINSTLDDLDCVYLTSETDLKKIPKAGGVYFIVTNEPVNHSFHNRDFPDKLPDNFEIIYNGTAQDLCDRAKKHLFREVSKGMSGISLDILTTGEKVKSHTKVCFSVEERRTPYIDDGYKVKRIKTIDEVYKLNLSHREITFVKKNQEEDIYFKNGIDIFDLKHRQYQYIFFFKAIHSHNVRDIIETNWRRTFGTPRLCTYLEGR